MLKSKLTRTLLVSIGVVTGLSACVYDPYYHYPPGHHYYPYYYPYYYDYYYYPGVSVYYQFSTGFYFYFSNNRWIRSKVLPPHIHLDAWDRVTIRVESDKPYLKHKEHVLKYQPRPRPPEYRVKPKPPIITPIPKSPSREVPRQYPQQTRPVPQQQPQTRPVPRTPAKPPVGKQESPYSRQERENNSRLFEQHLKKQQEYEKEWEKRNKNNRR